MLQAADDGANLIRNKAFGLTHGLLQPLQPIPANVLQPPAAAKDYYPSLPTGLDAWQRFIVSRLDRWTEPIAEMQEAVAQQDW